MLTNLQGRHNLPQMGYTPEPLWELVDKEKTRDLTNVRAHRTESEQQKSDHKL